LFEADDFQSLAGGVGQDSCACRLKLVRLTPHAPPSASFRSKNLSGVPPASAGVAQLAASTRVTPACAFFAPGVRFAVAFRVFDASKVVVVGHPVEPLPDVRRADARSAQIGHRAGVSRTFQVS